MPLKIDYDSLEQAMSRYDPAMEIAYFFDPETGDVLVVDGLAEEEARELSDPGQTDDLTIRLAWYILLLDGEIGEELPEVEETAMWDQAEAHLTRYIRVPTADSHESYQDMVDFAAAVSDPHLRDLLEVALNGKGAFRRFKDVLLGYPKERERWFAFSDQQLRERIDEWLRRQGVL